MVATRAVRIARPAAPRPPDVTGGAPEVAGIVVEAAGETAPTTDLAGRNRADVGGLVWDDHGGMTVVRSRHGLVPWFLAATVDGAPVATTSLDLLVGLGLVAPRLHEGAAAQYLTDGAIGLPGQTPIAGVTLLARGERAVLRDGGWRRTRYWDPLDGAAPTDRRAGAAEIAERLRDVLRRDLAGVDLTLLGLSGGSDSASLAALIAGEMRAPLATLTLEGTTPAGRADTTSFVDPLVERLGLTRTARRPHSLSHVLDAHRRSPPSTTPLVHPVLLALPDLVQRWRPDVLTGGELADELLGGRLLANELLRRTGPGVALRQWARGRGAGGSAGLGPRAWARAWRGRLRGRPAGGLLRDLPPLFRDDLREAHRQAREDLRRGLDRRHERVAVRWEMLVSGAGWVEMNWHACGRLGVRRSLPFLDPRIVEIAMLSRPRDLLAEGPKTLSRDAVRGVLPDRWLDQPKQGAAERVDPASVELPDTLEPEVEALLVPDWRTVVDGSAGLRAMVVTLQAVLPGVTRVTLDDLG